MDSFTLIGSFGERLGLALERHPDGTYPFEIDARAFTIHDIAECDRIVLSGDLGEPPAGSREKLCVRLLEAQHLLTGTAGATFSLDPQTGHFTLCKILVPAILDKDGFFFEAENFVNALHSWAEIIGDFRADDTAGDGAAPFLTAGFMPV